MQGNIQATEEQQKTGRTGNGDRRSDLSDMEVTSEGITVKPTELIADGHFVHVAFQIARI